MEFSDVLRSLRESRKLSAAQLAGAFEKSEGAIRMWETGRSKPDADTLIKLAQYFNCTTDYLLGLSEYRNTTERTQLETLQGGVVSLLDSLPLEVKTRFLKIFDYNVRGYALSASVQSIAPGLIAKYIDCLDIISEVTCNAINEILRLPKDIETKERHSIRNWHNGKVCQEIIYSYFQWLGELIERMPLASGNPDGEA